MDKLDEYYKFLAEKQTAVHDSGFEIANEDLNPQLFDFQRCCVKRALKSGRFAMFEDCGLGKTFQQLEWAYQVQKHINRCIEETASEIRANLYGYWRGDLSDYFKDGNFDYTLRRYKKDAYSHVMEWLENK